MKLRIANISSLFVMGVMVLSLAAGCGLKRNPASPLIDPAEAPSPAATTTPAVSPSASPSASPSINPVPVVPPVMGELTVKQPVITTTGLLMKRHVIATVEVANPTDQTLSGTVTCTFGDGSDADQVQSQNITLKAHEVRPLTFDEKAWFDKTAKVQVTTLHPAAANRLY